MSEFDIRFGKNKEASSISSEELKGGIKKSEIQDDKMRSIFEKLDNGNGILEQGEIDNLKTKIQQYAGEDNKKDELSKKEAKHLLKNLGIDVKVSDLFAFLGFVKTSASKVKNCETNQDTNEVSISYNDESETTELFDSNGKLLKTTKNAQYKGMKGKLTVNSDGSLVFSADTETKTNFGSIDWTIKQHKEYIFKTQADMDNDRPSKVVIKSGGHETVEEYTYHNNGKAATKESKIDGKLNEKLKYDEDGNVLEKEEYNTEGNLLKKEVNTYENGKIAKQQVFNKDNKLTEESLYDENGVIKEKTEYYEDSSNYEYSKVNTKYAGGKIAEENFIREDGTLFRKNEYDSAEKLTKQTEYFEDGKTIKRVVTYEGDDYVSKEYDRSGKLIQQTSSKPDGYFGSSTQVGQGDCYLMASINSIRRLTNGQKILKNLVQENNGTYTITLPGAKKVAAAMKGDSRFKKGIYVTGTYTFSPTQVRDVLRQSGTRYSTGDPDVILLEAAFERYREEIIKTQKANGINPLTFNFGTAGVDSQLDESNPLRGGFAHDAIFILTGQKSDLYWNYDQSYVASDDDLSSYDSQNLMAAMYKSLPSELKTETSSKEKLKRMLDKIMNDNKDGHTDVIATCSFRTQESGHELTIQSVTPTEVVLINPWAPDETITMTREEFVRKVQSVTIAEIPYQQMDDDDTAEPEPDPVNPVKPDPVPNPDNPEPVNPEPTTPPSPDGITKVKIKKGTGYNKFIKDQLAAQGYTNPTQEQIQKAKQQFEAANPKTKGNQAYVHVYNGPETAIAKKGNKYLIADLEYNVPKFVFD